MKLSKKRFWVVFILILGLFLFYRANFETPILMYHHIGDPSEASGVNVSTETFKRQMEFLKVHRYRVISLADFLKELKTGRRIPFRTVVITFDDGHLDNFKNAFPILKELNFPATIFVITGSTNKKGWLSEEDLRILDDSGISIGSHTVNHAFLPGLSAREAFLELTESKKRLEKILGSPTTLFSYPAGGVTPEIIGLVQKAGYEGAVTTNFGRRRHNPYALHRIKITEAGGNLFSLWIKTSGLYHLGKKRIPL